VTVRRPLRLLHLHPGSDTGGQSLGGRGVLEAAGIEVRVLVGRQHQFGYGVATKRSLELEREAYLWSDVVVVHNDAAVLDRLGDRPPRQIVVHHHGSQFRDHPDEAWRRGAERGAERQVVSTVDLLLSVPAGEHAEWIPQIVDLELIGLHAGAARGHRSRTQARRVVVSHAPTNRGIKGTRYVQRAALRMRGNVRLDVISNRPWWECLFRKALSDVFVDQLHLGYGNNAIEAWALGLPVIAGASDAILDRMRAEYADGLPFLAATPETVGERLAELVRDPDLRRGWADRGRAHLERYHHPDAWLGHAIRVYGLPLAAPRRRRGSVAA
jgi:hypothetical protein